MEAHPLGRRQRLRQGAAGSAATMYAESAALGGGEEMKLRVRRMRAAGLLLQRQMDEFEAAMALQTRVLAIEEAAYGSEHTEVAITLTNMGMVLRQQDKLDEAMAMYERALPMFEHLGVDHPHAVQCREDLAELRTATHTSGEGSA